MSDTNSLDELLAESGWLRRLAATLVGGDRADDVVQETWLRALRSPPSAGASARAWLARVARRVASNVRRSETRRALREADAAPPEAGLDPGATAEAVDALRALAEAVLRLPEPLRSTVVLRHLRGLDSAQIARLQSAPQGTVRWRLKRALELLRADLEPRDGGRGLRALALLAPAGTSERAPASEAVRRVAGAARRAAGASRAPLVATGAAALAATSWLALAGARASDARLAAAPESSAARAAPELALAAAPRAPDAAAPVAAARVAPARERDDPAAPSSPPGTAPVRGQMWIDGTDQPLDEPLSIRLRVADLSQSETVVCAPDGSFRTRGAFPRGYLLAEVQRLDGALAGDVEAFFEPDASEPWSLPVPWPTFVRARIVDRRGAPLEGAVAELSGATAAEELQHPSTIGESGELRWSRLTPGAHTLLIRRGFERTELRLALARGPNELGDVVVRFGERVGDVRGVLRCDDEHELSACVVLEDAASGVRLLGRAEMVDTGRAIFDFPDLPLGRYRLSLIPLDGRSWSPASLEVSPPAEVEFATAGSRESLLRSVRVSERGGDEPNWTLLARARGQWLEDAEALALEDVERWVVLAKDYRPASGGAPEAPLDVRLETGFGRAFLFAESGGDLEASVCGEGCPGRPLAGVEVLADGVPVARSGDDGLALVALEHEPESLEYRLAGWKTRTERRRYVLTLAALERE